MPEGDRGRAPSLPRRSFEALFARALEVDEAFARALAEVGYDPGRPQELYPLDCWRAALEVARQRAFAGLERGEAYRALGRLYVQGFARTVVGRVLATVAPLLGAERCLTRLPFYMQVGRQDLQVRVEAVGLRCWRLEARDPEPLPEFVAGAAEEILVLAGVTPRVEVAAQEPGRYALLVHWQER